MRPSVDEYYLSLLDSVAGRSTCARRAVAAIITDAAGHVLSTGYNGVPRGFPHCSEGQRCEGAGDQPGNSSRCLAVHAEQNAILFCAHVLAQARVIYCSCVPCFTCAKMILNTPIERVVVKERYADMSGFDLFVDSRRIDLIIGSLRYDRESGEFVSLTEDRE